MTTVGAWSEMFAWNQRVNEPFRLAMCTWLRAHGIDPDLISVDNGWVARHTKPNLPGVTYSSFVRLPNGNIKKDHELGAPAVETVWLPMEADPLPFPAGVYPHLVEEQQ